MQLLIKVDNIFIVIIWSFLSFAKVNAQHIYLQDATKFLLPVSGEQAIGRWDITITNVKGSSTSWLEIAKSGNSALVGRFLGRGGSVRPISEIKYSSETKTYSFTIPPQYGHHDLHVEFKLDNRELKGWMIPNYDQKFYWTAVRAPELRRTTRPKWGKPIHLLEYGLSAWKLPKDSLWKLKNGVLVHQGVGGNLITKQKFEDFKLHIEFRYTKRSNSGIYLRGRYEVQIFDSYGMHAESHQLGSIFGYIAPIVNASKKPGQWQAFDITLRGRMVTVILNGTKIIYNRPIPGITGGAIDSHEGAPGPIMLQGSERGQIEFKNIILTPEK